MVDFLAGKVMREATTTTGCLNFLQPEMILLARMASLSRLACTLATWVLLSSCAQLQGWVEISRLGASRLYVAPDSVKPHPGGKLSDWEATFLLEILPHREGFREASAQVVLNCSSSPRVSYSVYSLQGLTASPDNRILNLDHPGFTSRLGLEPLLAKGYEEICNRPHARASVTEAARLAAVQEEQKRAAAAQAAVAAQAELARRERARIEEAQQRARTEAAAKLQSLDEQMRLAEELLRRGEDFSACITATANAEAAKGTDRSATAIGAQRRICDEHSRMTRRRQEQSKEEEALLARRCEGTPRVSVEQTEWLARALSVNPRSLAFERLGVDGSRCILVVYHPRGVAKCSVDPAGRGVVKQIWRCDK